MLVLFAGLLNDSESYFGLLIIVFSLYNLITFPLNKFNVINFTAKKNPRFNSIGDTNLFETFSAIFIHTLGRKMLGQLYLYRQFDRCNAHEIFIVFTFIDFTFDCFEIICVILKIISIFSTKSHKKGNVTHVYHD